MKLKPMLDQIALEAAEDDAVSAGGIVLPTSSASEVKHGKVVAVGCGAPLPSGKFRPLRVKKGDHVIYQPDKAVEVKYKGRSILVIREADLVAKVRE